VLSADEGMLLWEYPLKAKAGSPIFYNGKLIIPSYDKSVYALSIDKACIITQPAEGFVIGHKEVSIKGTFVSEAAESVYIRVEGEAWNAAEINGDGWIFLLDPTSLKNGINVFECKVGSGDDALFSYVLSRDTSLPLGTFELYYPKEVTIGSEVNISVLDADNSAPIKDFTATVGGKTLKSSGSILLKLNEEGKTSILLKKTGFKDTNISINVKSSQDVVMMGVAAVALLMLFYFYFFIYKKK
jgi:hypothetical protein